MSGELTGKGKHGDFKGEKEKEPDEILVMRVPGRPTREAVQEFMHQTGAELVGAYRIWSGIANPNSRERRELDGMEFMFRMSSRDLGSPVEKTADIRSGLDMTAYYNEGFKKENQLSIQDKQKIADLVAKPGIKNALQRVIKEFNALPGKTLLLGITSGGLFVAVREGVESATFSSKYFKAVVLDVNLPPEETDKARIDVSFSKADVDRYQDGGTTDFPGPYNRVYIRKFKDLPKGEVIGKLSEEQLAILEFYKATGGFHFPSPLREPDALPSVGKGTLYPLPL